ncbi:hypothetical protein HAV22_26880 [Massilia sp. TW-1]|uniref:HEPN domain-containing protein n=1 Tax=Telluria antibiotica TaxID=2717319 RepID=A0ABX0PLL3_9BURK|nr:DUF5677 domain-containing protein [Telluria antibiotica]NIA57253.1 hypothetical protein [Telluria antibiotica]
MDFEGFSGLSGTKLREQQKENYMELFGFAGECSSLAMQAVSMLPKIEDKSTLPACLLFARAAAHFQAAISLAEGGMTIEALIIARSLVETSFVLGALAAGEIKANDLVEHDIASRTKAAKALLKPNDYENVEVFKERLSAFVSENAGSAEIKIFEFAKKADALMMYDGLYRHLSHFAAHPSLSATDPYLVEEDGKAFGRFQPILHYTPRAVLSACAGFLICFYCLEKIGVRAPETNARGTVLWDIYESLYARNQPWK